MVDNMGRITNPITSFIIQVEDSIPSYPIEGKYMKELGIRVPLSQPVDSGFSSPKIFFKFLEVIIF